ncbi:type VII secretion protein EccE [Mycobacterium montefiorense]|uniref:Type VII secretion protein EccE n=1 Tax=Mycobacterium montefiorense TaxID=154654 RepID=A0ABQ0NMV8_9MYCO|nr:type VII secretion protein EccE [Mycobacterium montefiorense]GBG38121.1 type VII secretion protein EccE [Mycobacterium montefiorense]GKU33729.1 type VII secretion protein EccE [Mycobacterium montefiorense]GKU39848.1 type VII secretion protein EccE [Mycobacterium montefiorense]GKU43655.1 type VII secretion protein EccE [Mycobacterium montefiorense]GKU51675.1 type VII secretion protein EccE [Mycobacterium montefiorense]
MSSIPIPGSARITLAALAIVPAALAYSWHSSRDYWLLGIAGVALIVLFGWWRGLHFTTILGRRLSIMSRRSNPTSEPDTQSPVAAKTTALVRIGPPTADGAVFPLELIAGYLDRYGIRADKVRITSRDNASDASRRETWIGITVSAADNLPALQARSSRIPLYETAEVAARRLADHLREIGWEANTVAADDVPRWLTAKARETWRAVQRGTSDYVAAYQITVDSALPETLEAIRSQSARETCIALEIGGPRSADQNTVAAACAFLADGPPEGAPPVAGLIPQRGNQGPALAALDLLSTQRLDGHTDVPADLLATLDWPTPIAGAHRTARTEAASPA